MIEWLFIIFLYLTMCFAVHFMDTKTGLAVTLQCPLHEPAIKLKQSLAKRLNVPWQLLTMRFNGKRIVLTSGL
jgi:hypothetical protein